VAILLPGAAAADEPRRSYQLELGPSLIYSARRTEKTGDGVSYDNTLAPGLLIRLSLAPWLRVSGHYERALHALNLPEGALGLRDKGATVEPSEALHITTISGYLHPTLNLGERFHLLGSVGIGWSSVVAPRIQITQPSGTVTTLRLRTGVFLEVPVGASIVWDVIPGWVTLSYEAMYAPTFGSSGDAFSKDPYVNPQGAIDVVGPLPVVYGSFNQLLTVALAL
jgi:hypothetical protein